MNSGNSSSNTSAFSILRHRNFRLLWSGLFISNIGSQMQVVAVNWHVYQLTHSAFALGLIGFFRIFPLIILSFIGGALADAVDRRKVIFSAQVVMMAGSAILGIMTLHGNISVLSIYILTAIVAGAQAFDMPSRHSLIPNLVPENEISHAVTLNNIMYQSSVILGPTITGFLIAATNLGNIYLFNALSFLTVIAAVLMMNIPSRKSQFHLLTLDSFKEGLKFVFGHTLLRSAMLLDFFATFFASASTLMPIYANDILRVGPQGLGILYAAPALGSVIAGIFMALFPNIHHKGKTMLISALIFGVATVFFGLSHLFILSLLFLAVTGAMDTLSSVIRHTLRQLETPDRLRGRMNAISMVFFMGGPQLGELEAGIAAGFWGAPFSVITGGIGTIIVTLIIALTDKKLLNYQNQPGRWETKPEI